MGKASLARIAAALAIISLYIFLFGFTVRIESLDDSIPDENKHTSQTESTGAGLPGTDGAADEAAADGISGEPEPTPPLATSAAEEKTVYTYDTTLNVVNGKKPGLADYTATQEMMIIPEATTTVTPTAAADVVLDAAVFNYVTTAAAEPVQVTEPEITSAETTTTAVATTAATTAQTTTTTTTTASVRGDVPSVITEEDQTEDTTRPPEEPWFSEDIDDIEDDLDDFFTDDPDDEDEDDEDDNIIYDDPDDPDEPVYVPVFDEPDETPAEQPAAGVTLSVLTSSGIVKGDAASIVSQAVMAEVGDSFHEEAIKAQAVATYTYLKYYNDNDQNAYAVLKTPSDVVTRCVNEVLGQAVRYNGELIQAVYCASTAGYTASAYNVWGIDYAYLQSRKTEFDMLFDVNYGRQVTFTADEVRALVQKNTGINLNDDPASWFEITSHVDGAYVGTVTIAGLEYYNYGGNAVKITGRVFRETIMEYNIRSSSFDISYDPATATFTFTTYGYGHGVGMSQHGANILATQYGYTYKEILQYYYQGTEVY